MEELTYHRDMSDEDFLKLISKFQIDEYPYFLSNEFLKLRTVGMKALRRAKELTEKQRRKEGKEVL